MSMRNSNQEAPRCPEDVLRTIPWYDDASLDDEARGRIEAHAAECAACCAEIAWMRGEQEPAPADAPDADAVYARVRARIEGRKTGASEASIGAERADSSGSRSRRRGTRSTWRRLALAASVLLALGIGLLVGRQVGIESVPPVYRTAEGPPPPSAVAEQSVEIDVIFRGDTSAERITDALRAIGGAVVDGPTRLGVYRLRLAEDADGAAAAKLLRGEDQGVATFAEVVP